MLGLISNIENILLFRESVHFGKVEEGKYLYLGIDRLRRALINEMNQYVVNPCQDFFDESSKKLIEDYIYLCFMLGNDFIPHLPMLHIGQSGVQYLLEIYKDIIGDEGSIIQSDGKPSMNVLQRLFKKLSEDEDEMVSNYYESNRRRKYRDVQTSTPMEKELRKIDFLPLLQPVKDTVQLNKPGWRSRYYVRFLRSREVCQDDIDILCKRYLEGLQWTFVYYTTGCKDWRWHFPNSCAPTSQDLYRYISNVSSEDIKDIFTVCDNRPLEKKVQLLSMMPPSSHALLPIGCRELMTNKDSPISDYYPKQFHVEFLYKRYFHESVLYLPKIDIPRVETALSQLNCSL